MGWVGINDSTQDCLRDSALLKFIQPWSEWAKRTPHDQDWGLTVLAVSMQGPEYGTQ